MLNFCGTIALPYENLLHRFLKLRKLLLGLGNELIDPLLNLKSIIGLIGLELHAGIGQHIVLRIQILGNMLYLRRNLRIYNLTPALRVFAH
jgi:hypothetical protein